MGILSKVICEAELPIPWDDFSDKENKIFSKVKWGEIDFYTSSFFDYEDSILGLNTVSAYTISDDGQFYKSIKEIKIVKNTHGELIPEERDVGIERQDFTGEILFWREIAERKDDYEVSFVALFFKGELKELNLEGWKKRSNKERKANAKKLEEQLIEEQNKRESFWGGTKHALKKLVFILTGLIKWVMFKILDILIRIEVWIIK